MDRIDPSRVPGDQDRGRGEDPLGTLSSLIDELERFEFLIRRERRRLLELASDGSRNRRVRLRSRRIRAGAAKMSASAKEAIGSLRRVSEA
jgi:hypothetical protein